MEYVAFIFFESAYLCIVFPSVLIHVFVVFYSSSWNEYGQMIRPFHDTNWINIEKWPLD